MYGWQQRLLAGNDFVVELLSFKQLSDYKDFTSIVEGGEGSRFLRGKYRSYRLVNSLVYSLYEILNIGLSVSP